MSLKSSDTVIRFEDLIKEMYHNKDDRQYLLAIDRYLIKYGKGYCLVHLYTLRSSLRGYFEIIRTTKSVVMHTPKYWTDFRIRRMLAFGLKLEDFYNNGCVSLRIEFLCFYFEAGYQYQKQ